VPVVNGKAYPYFEVKARAYRFRFLNGCNSRFLSLSLPDGPTFWQVRTPRCAACPTFTCLTFLAISLCGRSVAMADS
jgi:hypothetical protein